MKNLMMLTALLFLLAAPAALACEICKEIPAPDYYTCWSGEPSGFAWCYGGFGQYCTMGGKCTGGLLAPAEGTADLSPVLNSSAADESQAPVEGFVLDVEPAAESAAAPGE